MKLKIAEAILGVFGIFIIGFLIWVFLTDPIGISCLIGIVVMFFVTMWAAITVGESWMSK